MPIEKQSNRTPLEALAVLVAKRLGITDPLRASDSEAQSIAELLETEDGGPKADADLVKRWLAGELPEAGFIPRLAKLAEIELDTIETPAAPEPNPHPHDPPTVDELLMARVLTDGVVDQAKLTGLRDDIAQRAGVNNLDIDAVLGWCRGSTLGSRFFTPIFEILRVTLAEINFAKAKRLARARLAQEGAALVPALESCANIDDWAAIAGTVYPEELRGFDISRISARRYGIALNDRAASNAVAKNIAQDGRAPGSEMFSGAILAVNLFLADPRQALIACAWSLEGQLDPPGKPTHAALLALMKDDPAFSPDILAKAIGDEISRSALEDLLYRRRETIPIPATLVRVLTKYPPLCIALLGKMPDGTMPEETAQARPKTEHTSVPAAPPAKPSGKKPTPPTKADAPTPYAKLRAEWQRLIAGNGKLYGPSRELEARTGMTVSTLISLEQGYAAFTEPTAKRLVQGIPQLWDHLPQDAKARIPDPRPKKDEARHESPEPPALPSHDDIHPDVATEPTPPVSEPPPAEAPTPAEEAPPPDAIVAAPAADAPEAGTTMEPPPSMEAAQVETPAPEAIPGDRIVLAPPDANDPTTAENGGCTVPAPPPSAEPEEATTGAATPPRTIPAAAEEPGRTPPMPTETPAGPQRLHPDDIEAIVERVAAKTTPLGLEQVLALVAAHLDLPPIDHPFIDGSQLLHQNAVEMLRHVRELAASLKRAGAPVDNRVRAAVVNALVPLMRVYGLTPEMLAQAYEAKSLTADELAAHMASRKP